MCSEVCGSFDCHHYVGRTGRLLESVEHDGIAFSGVDEGPVQIVS